LHAANAAAIFALFSTTKSKEELLISKAFFFSRMSDSFVIGPLGPSETEWQGSQINTTLDGRVFRPRT